MPSIIGLRAQTGTGPGTDRIGAAFSLDAMGSRAYTPIFPAALGLAAVALVAIPVALAETASGAPSEGTGLAGTGEIILIGQIVLLLLVGRGLGEIMQRIGQPAAIGQLLAGVILGPSFFGWLWPHAHALIFPPSTAQKNLITGLSDIGVLLLLLLTGMETDLTLARKVGRPAVAVALTGIAIPFLCGFGLGQFLPGSILPNPDHRLVPSLFLGTALSISSIKIVAMVVRELNFSRRNLGQIIVASAIMEDTIGWVIVSVTLGIAGAGAVPLGLLAKSLIGTALFLILSYTVGRRLVFWLIRWVNDSFVSDYAVVTAILIVMSVMALITQAIGVNTVLGAFVAGVLVGELPILSQHIEDQLRGFITAFMMPIFFGLSGLSADLTILKNPTLALFTIALVAIASVGKFTGAFAGGMVSGLSRREAVALGCGMNARGSTEVIVASIGLTMGALTQNLYTMIVTMAVITTMAMPPMLRWALRRLPMSRTEKARLDKEDLDAKGFVIRLERLLIVADESANGKFASRLAGFIAGQGGKPVTVLHLTDVRKNGTKKSTAAKTKLTEVAAHSATEGGRAAEHEMNEARPGKVEVSARQEEKQSDSAVSDEAEKGYDLLFAGIQHMFNRDGRFSTDVDRLCRGFDGPLALAMAGDNTLAFEAKRFRILVPVNGTEASRRGAEIALALSPVKDSTITALHVGRRSADAEAKPMARPAAANRVAAKAVLGDVVALARRYGYRQIETASRMEAAPEKAIIEQAERSKADLIVMGASRRVGESLYLGETVDGVLRHWKGALVLVVM